MHTGPCLTVEEADVRKSRGHGLGMASLLLSRRSKHGAMLKWAPLEDAFHLKL